MPRSTPTTLALPPFSGATRRLVLFILAVFFVNAVLELVLPSRIYTPLAHFLVLMPYELAHGLLWQPLTFTFMPVSLLGTLFALLTLWFIGSMLEDLRGSRWLTELFFASAIGGAVVASALTFTHLLRLSEGSTGAGPWTALYGLLIATAILMGDTEFLFFFVIRIKAKYMVAIYILIDLATLLKNANAFGALLELSGALCGFLFIRYAPRRGLAFGVNERFFALRNEYYRARRRRTARKFEVYMRKQNREVHFDAEGRYVEPDDRPKTGNDSNKWMN